MIFFFINRKNIRDENPKQKRLLVLSPAVQNNWYVPLSAQTVLHLKVQWQSAPEETSWLWSRRKKVIQLGGTAGERECEEEQTEHMAPPRSWLRPPHDTTRPHGNITTSAEDHMSSSGRSHPLLPLARFWFSGGNCQIRDEARKAADSFLELRIIRRGSITLTWRGSKVTVWSLLWLKTAPLYWTQWDGKIGPH